MQSLISNCESAKKFQMNFFSVHRNLLGNHGCLSEERSDIPHQKACAEYERKMSTHRTIVTNSSDSQGHSEIFLAHSHMRERRRRQNIGRSQATYKTCRSSRHILWALWHMSNVQDTLRWWQSVQRCCYCCSCC